MDSLYNILINTVNRSASAISALYNAMSADIQHRSDRVLLQRADDLSGAQFSRNHIESFLDENRRYLANSYQGLAIVQTASQYTSRILDKLDEMKELAEKAAGGQYTQEQVQDFQQRFQAVMNEMNAIASSTRPGGFFMLATTAFGAVGIVVDRDQKVEIDSMDMTASGLGLLRSMDLLGNPADALASVQLAVDEVTAYKQHLEESRVALEDVIDILNSEREAILPALLSVRESRSAWQAVEALAAVLEDAGALSVAVQARIESDRALRLLLDKKEE